MLASMKSRWHRSFAELDSLATKYAPVILCGLLAATTFQKLSLILHTDGGGDLLGADIPKSMMLIAGQNPYSSNPWASPYPPFLLAILGGIIRVTSGSITLTPDTIGLISRNVRMAGLVADAIVALLVFLTLRTRGFSGLSALVPSAVFLALPSISLSPYYWFNSDVLGYVLGFNLSSGFGGGTSSFTMMNLLYAIFPSTFHFSLPTVVENQVWLAATAALFMAALGIVWSRARELSPVDVVALGLLVWLIPLRQIYTHYLVWAIVPFLMRGRLRQTLVVGSLLEFANTMSSWSWDLPPDPFPVMATAYGFFATSIVYLSVSLTALVFIVKQVGVRRRQDSRGADSAVLLERYPMPMIRPS